MSDFAGAFVVETHGLRKTFESEGAPVRALRGVDFTMTPGEFVAVMGPSGCGKSTLLNIVAGLDTPTDGDVSLAGEPVHLSNREFSLLQKLASDPTRVFLKGDLLREVWGFTVPVATRTLDAHACRLRRKLASSPRQFVITVRGVGYRLTEEL